MVRVWEMSGRLITELYHALPVRSVALSEDGMRVLTGSDDGNARLSDLSGNELFVFSDAEPIQQAAFATGGDQVITCSAHGVKTWDFGSPDSIIARYRSCRSQWATGRSSARIGAAAEWRMGVSYGLAPFSRTVRKDNLVQFGFKVDRALVVKTGVKSGAVIEGLDVIEDGGAGLAY
jgi:hypothetical protein